jgi:hypothetical protein
MRKIRLTLGVPRGSVLGSVLFRVHVNDIWSNIKSTTVFFTGVCVICRKITNKEDMEILHKVVYRPVGGVWTVENAIIINPSKCMAVRFARSRLKSALNNSLMDAQIPEASSCKY